MSQVLKCRERYPTGAAASIPAQAVVAAVDGLTVYSAQAVVNPVVAITVGAAGVEDELCVNQSVIIVVAEHDVFPGEIEQRHVSQVDHVVGIAVNLIAVDVQIVKRSVKERSEGDAQNPVDDGGTCIGVPAYGDYRTIPYDGSGTIVANGRGQGTTPTPVVVGIVPVEVVAVVVVTVIKVVVVIVTVVAVVAPVAIRTVAVGTIAAAVAVLAVAVMSGVDVTGLAAVVAGINVAVTALVAISALVAVSTLVVVTASAVSTSAIAALVVRLGRAGGRGNSAAGVRIGGTKSAVVNFALGQVAHLGGGGDVGATVWNRRSRTGAAVAAAAAVVGGATIDAGAAVTGAHCAHTAATGACGVAVHLRRRGHAAA